MAKKEPSKKQTPRSDDLLQDLLQTEPRSHPSQIGAFRILDLLGEGGMGAVYLAEQEEPVARQVALKVIHSSLRSPTALARFDAERNALARLSHSNVAVLHEAGATDDGFPYFAMEHVEGGEALASYCDQRKLPIRRRLELFLDACHGVQHAHQKGVLHRDLKPSNVLVTEKDGQAQVKVIDFSLAKSLDASPLSAHTQLTRGLAVGTPAYMSPEAWDASQDLDTRSDVFSLGVMLYELLVGTLPNIQSRSGIAIHSAELSGQEVVLPSVKAREASGEALSARRTTTQELDRRLSGDLDWVVRRALANERAERYPSVSALMDDLERHLRDEPVSVGPPTWRYQARKFIRRHRVGVGLSLVALAFLFLAGITIWKIRHDARERTRVAAELQREVERIEWLQRVLNQLPLGVEGEGEALIESSMERIRTGLDVTDTGLARYALGRGSLALGDPATARTHFEAALENGYEASEVKLSLGWALSELYELRRDALRRLPYPEERRVALEQADLELRQPALQLLEEDSKGGWMTPELLAGRVALQREELDQAIEHGRKAIERSGWLYEAHFLIGRALQRQGEVARDEKQDPHGADELFAAAAREVELGLEIGRSDLRGHRMLCSMVETRLQFVVRYGRPGTDELHQKTLEACRQARQASSEEFDLILLEARSWSGLSEVQLWDRGEDPGPTVQIIEKLIEEALERASKEQVGSDQISGAYAILGRALRNKGLYIRRMGEDPREVFRAAAVSLEAAIEADPSAAGPLCRLAEVLTTLADWNENRGFDAKADLDRAIEVTQRAMRLQPDLFEAQQSKGRAHLALALYKMARGMEPDQDFQAGEEAFQRAFEIEPESAGPPSGLVALKNMQGKLLNKRGKDSAKILREGLGLVEAALPKSMDPVYFYFQKGQLFLSLARNASSKGEDPSKFCERARETFQKGLDSLPNTAGVWAQVAEISLIEARWLLSRGASAEAAVERVLRDVRRTLQIDTRRADAHLNAGLALLVRARQTTGERRERALKEARHALDLGIEIAPKSAANRVGIARWAWVAVDELRTPTDRKRWQVGLDQAIEAERLDAADAEAAWLRGALLALDPNSRAEGERRMAEARKRNPRLALAK